MNRFQRRFAARMAVAVLALFSSKVVAEDAAPARDEVRDIARKWGEPVEGQALSISTERLVFTSGDRISLNIRVRNVKDQKVEVNYDAYMRPQFIFSVQVKFSDGRPVPLTQQGQKELRAEAERGMGSGRGVALRPGEETNFGDVVLTRLYDLTLAGKYTVSAKMKVLKPGDEFAKTDALSNNLEFTVSDTPYAQKSGEQARTAPFAVVAAEKPAWRWRRGVRSRRPKPAFARRFGTAPRFNCKRPSSRSIMT
jgi:hypothetical protein